MAKKPETVFRDRIRPQLEALKNTTLHPIQQAAISGTPDYLLCINGLFVALELKASKDEEPKPLQRFILGKIETRGRGISLVAYPENWQDIYTKLTHLSEENNVQVKVFDYKK